MTRFVLAYHGGKRFETKEEGRAHMTKWQGWNTGLGDKVIEPGLYFGKSKTVSAEGVSADGGSNPLSGITIVEAASLDEALDIARACPHVDIGGTIEVVQVMEM